MLVGIRVWPILEQNFFLTIKIAGDAGGRKQNQPATQTTTAPEKIS